MYTVSQSNLGLKTINYIKDMCLRLPDLKPLILFLKTLLADNELNSPYQGGLSSYSLVLMASSFLYSQDCKQIGKNLQQFLNFFGNYFRPEHTIITGT